MKIKTKQTYFLADVNNIFRLGISLRRLRGNKERLSLEVSDAL